MPESVFLIRLQGLGSTLLKEALAQVFSCEICEISKNTFLTEHLWGLLLGVAKLYLKLHIFLRYTMLTRYIILINACLKKLQNYKLSNILDFTKCSCLHSLEIWTVKLRFLLIYKNMLKSTATVRSDYTAKHENKANYNTDYIVPNLIDFFGDD